MGIYLSLSDGGDTGAAICFYSQAATNKLGGQTVEAVEVSIFHSARILLLKSFRRECLSIEFEGGNNFLFSSYGDIVRSICVLLADA